MNAVGVQISGVLPSRDITVHQLKGKRLAIDTHLIIHQYLLSTPSLDKFGRTTNHLVGVFHHVTHLLSLGIKPVYVFDGSFLEIRKHEKFVKDASQPRVTSVLSLEMINETKALITALGVPVVQAPAEGDAQAAHMCVKGDVFAVASTQYDALMYGAKRIVMNLRRLSKKVQLYELKEVLASCKMDHNQFVMFCMLIGTDFNPAVENQKNALRFVQKYRTFTRTFEKIKWQYGYLPKAVYEHIKTMPVTNKYQLRYGPVDKEVVKRILVEHGMSEKRIWSVLDKI